MTCGFFLLIASEIEQLDLARSVLYKFDLFATYDWYPYHLSVEAGFT